MDQVDAMFCKLCLQDIREKNVQVVEEVILKALALLSLDVSLGEKENYMCNDCFIKVFAAYDFKVMCLHTEKSFLSYIGLEKDWQIDLKEVSMKVEESTYTTITSDKQVCRLCMCTVDDSFISLEKLLRDIDMINKYIPEVNFNITKDPVVCKQCRNSLWIHIDFLRKWMDIEKTIKIEPKDDFLCVKSEETDVNFEKHDKHGKTSLHESNEKKFNLEIKDKTCVVKEEIENSIFINTPTSQTSCSQRVQEHCPVYDPKDTELQDGDSSEVNVYKCDTCHFETKYKYILSLHLTKHKDPSEPPMNTCDEFDSSQEDKIIPTDPLEIQKYKCEKCNYETKWKHNLKTHQITHEEFSEAKKMYKCSKCDYQTKWKCTLKGHQAKHETSPEVYKCDKCDFQSKNKSSLHRHKKIHLDPSQILLYKCDKCNFETRRKYYLTEHQIKHKSHSELQMYKCEKCDYETKWKKTLQSHQIIHETTAQVYKCNKCNFQSKRKYSLQVHQVVHKDPLEIQKYKCDKCDYGTHRQYDLQRHRVKHEVQMYKCEMCDFQNKKKDALDKHRNIHENLSEVQM